MRAALAFIHRLSIYVHGGADIGVTHQLLLHLERRPDLVQERAEGVPESMPADALAQSRRDGRGVDPALLDAPGAIGFLAALEGAGKNPMLVPVELRRFFPAKENFPKIRIE